MSKFKANYYNFYKPQQDLDYQVFVQLTKNKNFQQNGLISKFRKAT